jgi:hypothetical protein
VSCKTLDVNEDSCPEVVVIIPEDNQALCTEATVINPAITV